MGLLVVFVVLALATAGFLLIVSLVIVVIVAVRIVAVVIDLASTRAQLQLLFGSPELELPFLVRELTRRRRGAPRLLWSREKNWSGTIEPEASCLVISVEWST